jgi:hypothetical protein
MLTLTASAAALPGSFTAHITGTSGQISHFLDLPLTITGITGPNTHLGCDASNTCQILPGAGIDSCFSIGSACGSGTHHECLANSCATLFGAGPDRCRTNSDCGIVGDPVHGVCDPLSRSCVNQLGAQASTCASDSVCGSVHLTHFECQTGTCLIVGGAGSNQCAGPIGSSCASPFSCTFQAAPTALFIPPAASTNLSWMCLGGSGFTSCTVRKVGGVVLATGGASGNVSNSPPATSQYSLNCTNSGTSATDNKTVTVTVNGLIIHEIPPVPN